MMNTPFKTQNLLGMLVMTALLLGASPAMAGSLFFTSSQECHAYHDPRIPQDPLAKSGLEFCLECLAKGGVKYEIQGGADVCWTDGTQRIITSIANCSQFKVAQRRSQCEACFNSQLCLKFEGSDSNPNPVSTYRFLSQAAECTQYLQGQWLGRIPECQTCVTDGFRYTYQSSNPYKPALYCERVARSGDVTLSPGIYYRILSKKSVKAIQANGYPSAMDGVAPTLVTFKPGIAQHLWVLEETSGYFFVTYSSPKMAFDVSGGSTQEGAPIVQRVKGTDDSQKWRLEAAPEGGGTFFLVNKKSGKLLTLAGDNLADGATLIQSTRNGTDGQKWIIALQDAPLPPGPPAPAPGVRWEQVTGSRDSQS